MGGRISRPSRFAGDGKNGKSCVFHLGRMITKSHAEARWRRGLLSQSLPEEGQHAIAGDVAERRQLERIVATMQG